MYSGISFTLDRATHRSKDRDGKPRFNLKILLRSLLYHSKESFLLILDVFRGKKHFSETRKDVIGEKSLGSNRPYMSYPMKFTFYLHQANGY